MPPFNLLIYGNTLWYFVYTNSDPAYSLWVDNIGEGTIEGGNSEIEMSMIERLESFDDIIAFLFPPEVLLNPEEVSKRSFLSPLNRFVDEFNTLVLDTLPFMEGMFCPE